MAEPGWRVDWVARFQLREISFSPHAAGHCHNVACGIVNDHNGGLELLLAICGGNPVQVLVHIVHQLLHVHVNGGVKCGSRRF